MMILLHVAFLWMLIEGPEATDSAVCRKVAVGPKIDGKLDDPCWSEGQLIDKFPTFWAGKASDGTTKAKLIWDDEALYFSASMTDKELRAFGTKRNDYLWNGDVFEMFFKPSKDAPAYYELQANPRSVILEIPFAKRGDSFETLAAMPPSGMTAVALVDGTLDTTGDTDRSWTVEGKIPWSFFAPTGGKPKPGDVWSFALCRYDYGPEGTEPVLTSSAPLTVGSFHRYEDYGKLIFEAGPAKGK